MIESQRALYLLSTQLPFQYSKPILYSGTLLRAHGRNEV